MTLEFDQDLLVKMLRLRPIDKPENAQSVFTIILKLMTDDSLDVSILENSNHRVKAGEGFQLVMDGMPVLETKFNGWLQLPEPKKVPATQGS